MEQPKDKSTGASGELKPSVSTRVITAGGEGSVSGELFGAEGGGRIVEINGFRIEAVPAGHMIVTRNRDVPGVIGRIGTLFGQHHVNISRFHLGREAAGGEAMAVIETDAPVSEETLQELRASEQIISARRIEL